MDANSGGSNIYVSKNIRMNILTWIIASRTWRFTICFTMPKTFSLNQKMLNWGWCVKVYILSENKKERNNEKIAFLCVIYVIYPHVWYSGNMFLSLWIRHMNSMYINSFLSINVIACVLTLLSQQYSVCTCTHRLHVPSNHTGLCFALIYLIYKYASWKLFESSCVGENRKQ